MRSFASTIDEPMLFQIGDELPNLTRHTDLIIGGEDFKATQKVLGITAKISGDSQPDYQLRKGAWLPRSFTSPRDVD
jgi:hypothetical protein